jgi:hypothetical protein
VTPEEIAHYVDAAAVAMRLPLAPEHRPGVLRYFALAADMLSTLDAVPLAVSDESAEVFVPVSPAVGSGR